MARAAGAAAAPPSPGGGLAVPRPRDPTPGDPPRRPRPAGAASPPPRLSRPALDRLGQGWSDERFDALLLLYLPPRAVGYAGMGDFTLDPFGRARFRPEREVVPYAHTGVSLVHPRLFQDGTDSLAGLPARL